MSILVCFLCPCMGLCGFLSMLVCVYFFWKNWIQALQDRYLCVYVCPLVCVMAVSTFCVALLFIITFLLKFGHAVCLPCPIACVFITSNLVCFYCQVEAGQNAEFVHVHTLCFLCPWVCVILCLCFCMPNF